MSLTDAQRDRYATIVRRYLAGDYTMDPDDAGDVAEAVIAAYQPDQAARQAAMKRVMTEAAALLRALDPFIAAMALNGAPTAAWNDVVDTATRLEAALDATEQEARDGNE
ncbi:MAG TPA: hypothetical protein VFL82_03470 [Thermomicrobiales bacterium]|nr:hypothetical protein [Thermomicrobiales bacterium]